MPSLRFKRKKIGGARGASIRAAVAKAMQVVKGGFHSKYGYRDQGTQTSAGTSIMRKYTSNTGGPFPIKVMKTVRYCTRDIITVGTSGLFGSIKEYNLNGLFDPDHSGTGHQPYFFDELSSIWGRYKVYNCKVRFEIVAPTGAADFAIGYMITNPAQTASTIAGATLERVKETNMGQVVTVGDTGARRRVVNIDIPISKAFNFTKSQFNDDVDQTTAAVTGNPPSPVNIQIACADLALGSSGSVTIITTLTFWTQFYSRKFVAQS